MLYFSYMKILEPELAWSLQGDEKLLLDGSFLALLRAVSTTGSLARAARVTGFSYRHAWGRIARAAEGLGAPLVQLEQGRGARLTPLGERLLAMDARLRRRLNIEAAPLLAEMAETLPHLEKPRGGALSIRASHDLLLAALRERLDSALPLDIVFQGSSESLESLRRGQCRLAGFHLCPQTLPDGRRMLEPFLRGHSIVIVLLAWREQGLMVGQGNPRSIRELADLVRLRVRFINRQRGSGTRLLFDRLLAEAGVSAAGIAGYSHEEFTHQAVAATVASGGADAGFGIRAAAHLYGLAFIPLAREAYYLACRRKSLGEPAVQKLLQAIRGPELRAAAAALPGYDVDEAGKMLNLPELLASQTADPNPARHPCYGGT
jgi:putative molybdopterin biosynthesis protein